MKTLKQVQDRITHLESRTKDGINLKKEIDALKEIEALYSITDEYKFGVELYELFDTYSGNENYGSARICMWALE